MVKNIIKTNKIAIPNDQSICYHQSLDGKDYFHKKYHAYISKSMLETYHTLHKHYGKKRKEIILETPISTPSGEVNRISYTILPLDPQKIYEGMRLDGQRKSFITMPNYIDGPVLDKHAPGSRPSIIKYLKQSLPEERMKEPNGLGSRNIKVISQKNGVLYLVITDLSMDIMDYVRKAENADDSIISPNNKSFNTPSLSGKI